MPNGPTALLACLAAIWLPHPMVGAGTEPSVPETLAWRVAPDLRYAGTEKFVHVISYEMSRALHAVLGSRAQPTTIIERRQITLSVRASDGRYEEADTDVRRFGGTSPKSTASKERTFRSSGVLTAVGPVPSDSNPLTDAGEGGLAELPRGPVKIGQSWTFSRPIKVDVELGKGTMTYTDTLTRVEQRGDRRVAVIRVSGEGRVDAAADLRAKGFKTAPMTLRGSAEFDLTAGSPGSQHYAARAQWNTRVMLTSVGILFDDSFDSDPWVSQNSPQPKSATAPPARFVSSRSHRKRHEATDL
ncbi:MAG: hypothetical protein GIW99_00995 [Candidatus Eremiobacteraeota bacterium]|nr:hypothetical protein [Candidatus Eremiobacteraeota bacterium]MBC5826263.1 hypothetical protein [Candidatus Eremiobacteraeota bacterium]